MKKPPAYTIIYQDDAIVAVNKSAGIASTTARRDASPATAAAAAAADAFESAESAESVLTLLGRDPALAGKTPRLVHRVETDASGLLITALTSDAQGELAGQFGRRTILQDFLAFVRGTPLEESGVINLPIGIDRRNHEQMAARGLEAQPASTKWRVENRYAGVTLLRATPITHRRHQVRVHLQAAGYPLAVDPVYGGPALLLSEFKRKYKVGKLQEERPLLARLSLHAASLTFMHPTTRQDMTITAEPPKDWQSALTALNRWAPYRP